MSLELFNELLTKLTAMGPEMLLGLAVICLCFGLKAIPVFPNKWIPAVCIFSPTFLYPILASCHESAGVCRCGVIGFLIGAISWLLHNQVLKRLAARFGNKEDDGNGNGLKQ